MSDDITKQNIVLNNKKWVKLEFGDDTILINPYISLDNKVQLMKVYIDSYFSNGEFFANYLGAEYSIVLAVIDLCTNIEITNLKADSIINSGLYDQVISHINNYYETIDEIQNVVKIMREDIALEKSIGNTIGNLSAKISGFIDKITEMDFSKEGVSDLIQKLNDVKPTDEIAPIKFKRVIENKIEEPVKKTRKKKIE